MQLTALTSLLLKFSGSILGETVDQTLRAAGARVTAAATPCRLLAEAARAEPPFRYIVLGVDYFAQEEFRLFSLLRREWPEAVLVAYHSPGFEYKGQLAGLVGADVVLADAGGLARFLETLGGAPGEVQRPRPMRVPIEEEAYLAQPLAQRRAEPAPEPTAKTGAEMPDRTRLTAEELHLLLGEEDSR